MFGTWKAVQLRPCQLQSLQCRLTAMTFLILDRIFFQHSIHRLQRHLFHNLFSQFSYRKITKISLGFIYAQHPFHVRLFSGRVYIRGEGGRGGKVGGGGEDGAYFWIDEFFSKIIEFLFQWRGYCPKIVLVYARIRAMGRGERGLNFLNLPASCTFYTWVPPSPYPLHWAFTKNIKYETSSTIGAYNQKRYVFFKSYKLACWLLIVLGYCI